ncbi:cobalamin 5'-phosphate synthase [Ignisphaera aggregans DSM 17230]|uniref:Adenosylcobinamide-GDP ribazoletransferase n=1 Tax=Ignisphaera aggregans (strain DSM 17230 / JCM 13409 / AQ1.S1) TaxID=583356 RepID=E0SR24_IGNAA|nr:cobalamin 5'-phosphate synthase [Ignisphaera aggregans DSM 17230]
MKLLKGIKSLLSLLTTIPIGEEDIESGARVFYLVPLIGLLEGCIAGAILSLMKILQLSIDIIAVLYIAIHIAITGGIHIDGYADYLDAIGSHRRGEEALKIMKDPRKGTFSIAILTLSLITSYISMKELITLDLYELIPLLISIYVSATESMYIVAAIGREEPYMGLGYMFSRYAKPLKNIIMNIAIYVLLILLLLAINMKILLHLLAIVVLTIAISLLSYRDSRYRIGFITGDVMGFTYELLRILSLLILSITTSRCL